MEDEKSEEGEDDQEENKSEPEGEAGNDKINKSDKRKGKISLLLFISRQETRSGRR